MKDDEIDLIVQLSLESRTSAYIEWLANELIMTAKKNKHEDSLVAMFFAKRKPSKP